MTLQISQCEQGSPEWFALRLGIPTASEFKSVMCEGRGSKEGKKDSATRRTYMMKLLGERLTQKPKIDFSNGYMERGKEMEGEARELYAMAARVKPLKVGFLRRGDAGASPDSLINKRGALEIKVKVPHVQLEILLRDEVPNEHKAQLQGALWVAERDWIDFVSYWPGLPLFTKRVQRDERYIEALEEGVRVFNMELAQMVEYIQNYGKRHAA